MREKIFLKLGSLAAHTALMVTDIMADLGRVFNFVNMSKIYQGFLFLVIGLVSGIMTLLGLLYTTVAKPLSRNKMRKKMGSRVRSLTLRMGVPSNEYIQFMYKNNDLIRHRALQLRDFGYGWVESMAVEASQLYEGANRGVDTSCFDEDLMELCKKRGVPDWELEQLFPYRVILAKFRALKLDEESLVGNKGYPWLDRLSMVIKTIYEESNAQYLACNNFGVPKKDFYKIYGSPGKIQRRVDDLLKQGEIKSFFRNERKEVLAIVDIYYENVKDQL